MPMVTITEEMKAKEEKQKETAVADNALSWLPRQGALVMPAGT